MATERNSIFKLGDKLGIESPLGDWMAEARAQQEERDREYREKGLKPEQNQIQGGRKGYRNLNHNEQNTLPTATSGGIFFGIHDWENEKTIIYSYDAVGIAQEYIEQFINLKKSYDYLKTTSNKEAQAILTEMETSEANFLFRVGYARKGGASEMYQDGEVYYVADVTLLEGKILSYKDQKYGAISPVIAYMAHELGHIFEIHFNNDGLANSPIQKVIRIRSKQVEVLPFVNVDKEDGRILYFIKDNALKGNTNANLAKYGLVRMDENITPYFGRSLYGKIISDKYGIWKEYIAMFIQNLFASGLQGEAEEKSYETVKTNYKYLQVKVDIPTQIPK